MRAMVQLTRRPQAKAAAALPAALLAFAMLDSLLLTAGAALLQAFGAR